MALMSAPLPAVRQPAPQTKDTLTLRASSFGSKCELPDAYLKKVGGDEQGPCRGAWVAAASLYTRPCFLANVSRPTCELQVANCGIVDLILSFASFKADKELKKGDGAKRQRLTGVLRLPGQGQVQAAVGPVAACMEHAALMASNLLGIVQIFHAATCPLPAGIPKLEDANDAGGRSSEHCTLILTEGDSAKSLAVAGLSVVGRDRFGVFPLRCAAGRVRRWARGLLAGPMQQCG